MKAHWVVALAPLVVASCGPAPLALGHLLVYLDTDAPVPGDPAGTPALLDSVRLEVVDEADAVVAIREVGLDHARLVDGLSFTVVPGGRALRLRATSFLAATGATSPPVSESVVATFALPAAPSEGERSLTLFLPLGTLGAPSTAATLEPGRPPPRAGSFVGALRTPCRGTPRPSEVCVPGGAFYMGHPALAALGLASANRRRLVVISPFFLDPHEVTVAAYRRDGKVFASRWSGSYAGTDPKDHCTFTEAIGPHEAHPINCVRWEKAREFCRSQGGDLPTEAQLEWVASALGTSSYPWGSTAPTCADLVFGRGGGSAVPDLAGQPRTCVPTGTTDRDRIGFPDPVDAPLRPDAVLLPGGGVVRDLAGNLREWARDVFATQDASCWAPRAPNVFVDPRCNTEGPLVPSGSHATRGTGFYLPAWFAPAAVRSGEVEGAHLDIGFRCARPDP